MENLQICSERNIRMRNWLFVLSLLWALNLFYSDAECQKKTSVLSQRVNGGATVEVPGWAQ